MERAIWGGVAFALSASLTALCIPLARSIGAVARPREDRWHRKEIPLLGGIGIALGTAVPFLAAGAFNRDVLVLLAGALLVGAVGLVDDLRGMSPQTKLFGQLLAATLVVALGLRLSLFESQEIDIVVTLFWIVALTNAFNLLDNMDGLAAGVAAIAAGFRLVFFAADGNSEDAAIAAMFLGATLGFLVFNRQPARIFMGDAGSMYLGFFVAGLSLIGGYPYSRGTLSILLLPVLVLLVPIFDTAFVTATRILARRPISVGGRDHTSHRLVALGLSEQRAVWVLYLLATASGAIAYLSYRSGFSRSGVLVVFLVLTVAMLAMHLSRVKVHPIEEGAARRRPPVVPVLLELVFRRRQAPLVLLDFVMIIVAYQAAYLLRFEDDFDGVRAVFRQSLPLVIACQLVGLAVYRTSAGIWRYTSLADLVRLVQAATVGTVLAVAAVAFAYRFEGFSRTVFVLDWLLLTGFLCGSRVAFRLLGETLRPPSQGARRILVYGAGDGGELAVREMLHNPALRRTPVGFLDDDPAKQRRRIRGVPVVAGADDLEELLRREPIDEVIVASRKISDQRMRAVAEICAPFGVRVRRARAAIEVDDRVA
jgi:UDP-GlcNAc:undecaprenyl-phosphate GlcNAc-1-phosphate transferase